MTDDRQSVTDLLRLLRALTDRPVQVGVRPIRSSDEIDLSAAEGNLVASANGRRRAEFASGRVLLRSMLGTGSEILQLANGAPRLPDAWVGSLAHDRSYVVAMIAPSIDLRAVGIDVEPVNAVDESIAHHVLRADDEMPGATAAFVAKEAAYKAWSGLGAPVLEHHDVNVRMTDSARFVAMTAVRGLPALSGRFGVATERVVAVVTAEAAPPR